MERSFEKYKRQRSFVLGFHGCSREVGEAVLAGRVQLARSDNDYDWLGPGIYFWEDDVVGTDRLKRKLDCATINTMHSIREMVGMHRYDSVRGAFWEGGELYPGAKISSKGHVQIAVTNPECILGYFRPLLG